MLQFNPAATYFVGNFDFSDLKDDWKEVQHAGLLDAIERNRTEPNRTILSRAKHNRAVLYYKILEG